jgi:cytoskeletal protein CcmA (bactofilin family)
MWWRRNRRWLVVRGGLAAFIDEGSEFEGRYTATGTVLLNGRFRGEIEAKDTLIVGERGVVHAAVRGGTVRVHGEVVGNVEAADRIELRGQARVVGDLEAPLIVIEEGVQLDGHCRMSQPRLAEAPLQVVPGRR